MADDNVVSRYVKLTKEGESPLEEIRPGELNQPVQVPQLVVHTCRECGQPLPESYGPPADEPWTTGICGCAEDRESLWLGLFCPCVLFGRNVERMREETPWTGPCTCHAIFVEGGMALALATAIFHGVDPHGAFLIGEGLLFAWWMCGIYTGLFFRNSATMASAGAAAEEGSLGTRPSHDLVKVSRKAVSRIESELEWKIKAITALPNPPDMDISLCKAAKAAMETEAKKLAEEEKAPHRSVIQLEELYQMYENIMKKPENSAISRSETHIQGNMKLDVQQLLHELNSLILFNLPDSAHKLSTIGKLDLSNNNMKCLPESLTSLVNLRTLDVHSNQLTSLPQSMGRLQKLKILDISGNLFAELPESVQNCRSLEELIADFNKLQRLPETLGIRLFNLQKLSVHSNKLSYLPSSISCLMSLRVLDVHMNKLRYLPEDIDNLVSLQILNVSCNFGSLNALPDSICGLCWLVEFDASYNQIKTLPDFIGGLVKLKRLNLEGNPLIRPPPEIVRDGLEAINKYMSDRATKSLVSRRLSDLGGKLARKWLSCTGETVAMW